MSSETKALKHVLLIADGSRRWAKERHLTIEQGYKAGAKAIDTFIQCSLKQNIKSITIWIFSTANWNRPHAEVTTVMSLIEEYLKIKVPYLHDHKICFKHIGNKVNIAKHFHSLNNLLETIENETKEYLDVNINIAIDYSITDEIVRIINRVISSHLSHQDNDWNTVKQFTDTYGQSDVDLIIRTSGRQRLSGIMPLQTSFAELVFIDKHLPDFSEEDVNQAFTEYFSRERTYGH